MCGASTAEKYAAQEEQHAASAEEIKPAQPEPGKADEGQPEPLPKRFIQCPKCGNRDQTKMHVARRTCGYIGTQYWNQGRTQEIADRVLHVSTDTFKSAR